MVNDSTEKNGAEKKVLLRVENLKKYFPIEHGFFKHVVGNVRAVDDISFDIHYGETLGLVGEFWFGENNNGSLYYRSLPGYEWLNLFATG